jgi:hypothetical protein
VAAIHILGGLYGMIVAMLHSGGVCGLLLFWDLSVLSWGFYMEHSGFEKVHQCRKTCYVKYLFIVVYMIYAVKPFLGKDINRTCIYDRS